MGTSFLGDRVDLLAFLNFLGSISREGFQFSELVGLESIDVSVSFMKKHAILILILKSKKTGLIWVTLWVY